MSIEDISVEIREFVDAEVSIAVKAATSIDADKVNVNGKPFYIGPVMVLSDQDVTALKHHVLSSAVMGTVFASLIVTLSNPEIPLIWRACLLGGILTGLQGVLVAVSNVGIVAFETWSHHGRPLPFAFCGRCCRRVLSHVWTAYISAHTVHLSNGATVWIDEYGYSVMIDEGTEQ